MTAARVYSLLLRLYPASFRREYGAEMLEAFRQLHTAQPGRSTEFWRFIAIDVCRSAVSAQTDAFRSGPRRFALEWTCTCALGAIMTALLANALTSSFRYLYHPYLEGVALPAWSYGALLGIGLGAAQNLVVNRRLRLGIRWIVGSAVGTAIGLEAAIATAKIAGPLGYGIVLGGVVGGAEWAVLRTHTRHAAWWALGSVVALSTAMLSWAVTMHTTLQGLDALSYDPFKIQPEAYDAAVGFLARGLYAPSSAADLTLEFAVMLTCGLVIAALTAKPLALLNGHQDKA